ncbi:MAG: anaerobic ribonucleoside-triphosphate reductase activating protein [Odoribacteraceae bacterium]|jgi:anaerobic ribonucleoside-triphosphate reductase activating protein|nr:anaerobic ribonucleoside-triphosphate reductase activating protein [Odoribacteraceae bacterium]
MIDTLSLLRIVEDTTVDGPGFRTSIYAAGCPRRCPGCHNPLSWDINNGTPWSLDAIMERVMDAEFSNVTFTGGDPLAQVEGFTALARRLRRETSKTIWCYTGYLYEEVAASPRLSIILPFIDVLVDGPYVEALRDLSARFVGSSNQRLVDVRERLAAGR